MPGFDFCMGAKSTKKNTKDLLLYFVGDTLSVRHSQRKSYNVVGVNSLIKGFEIAKPRIYHDF